MERLPEKNVGLCFGNFLITFTILQESQSFSVASGILILILTITCHLI